MTTQSELSLRTRTSTVRLRLDGILQVDVDVGAEISLADASASSAAQRQLAGGIKRPILVNMTKVKSVSREARIALSQPDAQSIILAIALITDSPISKIIANFFMRFNKASTTPTRLFTREDDANAWLATLWHTEAIPW